MADLTWTAAIPTRDRPGSLARLVDALLAQQTLPVQIIAVDDGKLDDATRDALAARCERKGVAFLYRSKTEPNRSVSRNMAAEAARGDVVIYFDDDCVPDPDFAARLLEAMAADERLVAVEGQTLPHARHGFYQRALRAIGWWALAPRPPRDVRLSDGVLPARWLGGVMAVRRTGFEHEQFDPSLVQGEDREFSIRLARHGLLGRVETAVCHHQVDHAGRAGAWDSGTRLARCYLHSQGKLFGWSGVVVAVGTLLLMSLLELALTVRGGLGHVARAGGILAGTFTPWGHRGESGSV